MNYRSVQITLPSHSYIPGIKFILSVSPQNLWQDKFGPRCLFFASKSLHQSFHSRWIKPLVLCFVTIISIHFAGLKFTFDTGLSLMLITAVSYCLWLWSVRFALLVPYLFFCLYQPASTSTSHCVRIRNFWQICNHLVLIISVHVSHFISTF